MVYQSDEYFIVRKKVFTSWGFLMLFVSLGLFCLIMSILIIDIEIIDGIVVASIGVVLIIAPFFNYLTATYRSLVIDRHNKTMLFRSGYSRAYLFTEVKDVKLEVQAKHSDTNAFSDSNKEFHYTITAYMVRGDKEELLSLKFRNEDNEHQMFDLKDYFQTLLTYYS